MVDLKGWSWWEKGSNNDTTANLTKQSFNGGLLKALDSPQNGGEGMNGSERAERFDEAGILKKESLNCRLLQALDWSREILESSSHGISTVALKETSGSKWEEQENVEDIRAQKIFNCKLLRVVMNSGENQVNIGRGICRVVMEEDGVDEILDRFEAAAIVIQRWYREYRAHKHGLAASSANNFGWYWSSHCK